MSTEVDDAAATANARELFAIFSSRPAFESAKLANAAGR
jgi:hypothetical protein